jgi:hypothetical protein
LWRVLWGRLSIVATKGSCKVLARGGKWFVFKGIRLFIVQGPNQPAAPSCHAMSCIQPSDSIWVAIDGAQDHSQQWSSDFWIFAFSHSLLSPLEVGHFVFMSI